MTNGTGTTLSHPARVSVAAGGRPALTIEPGTATLAEGACGKFQVRVTGLLDTGVIWSVAGGGRIENPMANPVSLWAPLPATPMTLRVQSLTQPLVFTVLPIQVKSTDLNGDGVVDVLDLALLAQSYGRVRGEQHFCEAADLNGDGQVDDEDAAALLARLGAL